MITLKSLYGLFANHPEGQWILKPESAQSLYNFVKTHDVKKVLELGTGIGLSTAIVALALKEKGVKEFTIDTVEQYEKCTELAKKLIPEELKTGITFHRIDAVLWETPEIPGQMFANFKELPDGQYDLIVVDGPGPYLADGKLVENPNGDVLRLHSEGKLPVGALIYFDGRLNALGLLERYYGHNFWLLDGGKSRSHVIERKDNLVELKDVRLESYKRDGYFK